MMNANELAEIVESAYPYGFAHDAALMLRQQQAEIEALKSENNFFKDLMGDVEILRKAQEK